MVQNINKLKGKITENGYTIKTLADKIGICEATLRKKVNNNNSEFSISESLRIKEELKLSNSDYLEIFFGQKLEFNS